MEKSILEKLLFSLERYATICSGRMGLYVWELDTIAGEIGQRQNKKALKQVKYTYSSGEKASSNKPDPRGVIYAVGDGRCGYRNLL